MTINRIFTLHFGQMLLPLVVILAIVTAVLYRLEVITITSVINTEDTNKVQLMLKTIRGDLRSIEADVLFLSEQQNLQKWINNNNADAKSAMRLDMLSFMSRYPQYEQIRYLNADGQEVIRIDRQQGQATVIADKYLQDKSNRYYTKAIQELPRGQVYISPFDLNIERGKIEQPYKPMIRIGTPVYDRSGQLQGCIVLNYLGAYLLKDIHDLELQPSRQVWLLNSDGFWLLGPSPQDEWNFMWSQRSHRNFPTSYPDIWAAITAKNANPQIANTQGLFTYATVNSNDFLPQANNRLWYALSFTPASYIDTQIQIIINRLAIFFILVTGLIVLASWITAHKEVARATSDKQLRDREEQYRNLLEGAPDAIVIVDQDGAIRLINAETEKVFGYTRNELIGQSVDILLPQRFQKHHHHHRQSYIAQPTVRPMGASSDLYARRKDGSEFSVEISLSPLLQENETLVTAIIRDTTIRKEHDQEIKRLNYTLLSRTTELEAINKELEAFSYSVSHDLRAPLRAVDGFSQTLLKDYGDLVDQRGRDRLQRIRAAAQRMGLLIDDLLTLSRISRSEVHKKSVDLTEMINTIVADLQHDDPERSVKIIVQASLTAHADKHLLSIAMTNLISNAWKFTSRVEEPCITVRGNRQNNEYVYVIEDNGAGFNMDYVDKLFGAFQRLHNTDEFPGTGIGLATVQRVIHKHSGRIWAEAEEGKGAKFYFTLRE